MFGDMVRLRRFEEQAGRAYQRRKIRGFCHLYIGQEAVAVGTMSALGEADSIVTHYREHGHALARGLSSNGVMAELFGKVDGYARGKGGSMHIFDASRNFYGGWGIVGGQIALGAGVAFANKYRGEKSVCVCFLGEGAIHQGIVHESLNMAAKWRLPLITIIENNRYAMGTSIERISAVTDLTKKAVGYDMFAESVDGQDVFSVHAAVKAAADRANNEGRPSFLEMRTYRYRGHSMTDPSDYRSKEEVEQEQDLRDPIVRLRNWIVANKLKSQDELNAIDDAMDRETKDAVEFADKSEFIDPSELTTDVYVEWPFDIE
ncbi:MAG: pyruvate dehydrogenase (acetyl-transferring) E1 component subunit alpha [Bradymonadaceae bacterium]|nr:pyruvate dehydrogenase (acetyl-transferring) E1 component subunit alpha [Lujinxingiaceae bacterium]